MARAPRADGSKFARDTAADLARPMPKPPLPLDRIARKYWPQVIGAKRPAAWTDVDYLLACQLCRDLATVAELGHELRNEPRLTVDAKGVMRPHPGYALLDETQRRILATMRTLQIHAHAVTGRARDQAEKNAAASAIADALEDADADLIAGLDGRE